VTKKDEEVCQNYFEESRQAVLQNIIADKQAFDAETVQLGNLKDELLKIREQI
jgi:hypothetical protein